MEKIYYNEKGWVCERYPYDLPKDEDRFIEVEKDDYEKTFTSPIYFAWRVVNNKLVNEEYDDLTPEQTREKAHDLLRWEIEQHQEYLAQTDYVVVKINEAQAEGDEAEISVLREKYAEILVERKRRRVIINDLKDKIIKLNE